MSCDTVEQVLHKPDGASSFPIGWQWQPLDEIADVIDCPHTTPETTESGPYMVRTQDIRTGTFLTDQAGHVSETTYEARIERGRPEYGDLLFSREGTYFGIAAEVPAGTRVCLGQRMVLIKPSSDLVNFRFLKYWLNSPTLSKHLEGFYAGTTAQRLNLRAIRAIAVPCPPMDYQDRVADILGTLDDKVDLNRKMNRTLESMARAIFKSWFVDFDPVRAKMDGEEPTGVDPDTADLFPDRLVDSELGQIPEGWEVKPIKEIINVTPRRKLSKGDVAPYLKMAHAPEEGHYPHDFYDREFNGSGSKFKNGDTLMAKITPCLENGKTAFVDFLADDDTVGWGSTEYLVLRSREPYPLEYSYYLARSRRLRRKAIKSMSGTSGRQRVSVRGFRKFKIVVPPPEIAQRFGELASDFMAKIRANHQESRILANIRDELLPILVTGAHVGEQHQPQGLLVSLTLSTYS